MQNNSSTYDFIYPSAANPNMNNRAKKNQTKNSQTQPPPQNKSGQKRNSSAMDTSTDQTLTNHNNSSSTSQNDTKKSKTDAENCSCSASEKLNDKLDGILQKLNKLDDIQQSISDLQNGLQANKDTVRKLEENVEDISDSINNIQSQLDDFRSEKVKIESAVREMYLILAGINDDADETEDAMAEKIQQIVKDINPANQFKYDTLYRIGKFQNGKTRKIRVKFLTMKERNSFLSLRKDTKRPVFIDEDEPNEIRTAKFQMREKIRSLKQSGDNVTGVSYKTFEIETDSSFYRLERDGNFASKQKPNNPTTEQNS